MSGSSLFDMSEFGPEEPEDELVTVSDNPEPEVDAAPLAPPPGTDHTDSIASSPTPSDIATTPTALYRKYRPQTFAADEHFGQEHVVNTLRNAIALNRIAHAYLFCGPRGTGKTSTARILAKAVNCEDPDPANRPCNKCASCIAINTGATTDVIEIDAASNRGIDDIRDLRERVKYAPTQLKTKFYIIDEAHQITGAAANAFLKTLEEPPAHTKFVLATTDPEDLLQTIVSRCQRFDFRRISLDAIVANLTKIAKAEHIEIDDDAKLMIARHATGSLRDAQGLLDQVAVYKERSDDVATHITVDLVRTILGVSRNDRVATIARALADRDAAAGVRAIGEAMDAGDDVRQLARQLLAYMRELLLQRSGGNSDLDEEGRELAAQFDLADLAELTRLFGDIDYKTKHAAIAQLPLEIAVVQAAIRSQVTAPSALTDNTPPSTAPEPRRMPARSSGGGSLVGRVQGDQRSVSRPTAPQNPPASDIGGQQAEKNIGMPGETRPAPKPAKQTPPSVPSGSPAAASPATSDDFARAMYNEWNQIRSNVHATSVRVAALLNEAQPRAREIDTLILTVPYPFHASKINSDEARPIIEEAASQVLGTRISIEAYTVEDYKNRKANPPGNGNVTTSQPTPPQAVPADTANESDSDIDVSESFRAVKNIFDADEIQSEDL